MNSWILSVYAILGWTSLMTRIIEGIFNIITG